MNAKSEDRAAAKSHFPAAQITLIKAWENGIVVGQALDADMRHWAGTGHWICHKAQGNTVTFGIGPFHNFFNANTVKASIQSGPNLA